MQSAHDHARKPPLTLGALPCFSCRSPKAALSCRAVTASDLESFRSLVEMTEDWVWEVDRNGIYTYASPRCRDILGYEPHELVGRSAFALMPGPESKRIRGLFRDYVARQASFRCLENVNRHKDGRLVVLESSGIPIFDNRRRLAGYRGMDRDITERKRAEEALRTSEARLRQVLDASPVPLSVDDMKGTIEYLNGKFVEKFGYAHAEIPTSASWFSRAYPDPRYRRQVAEQWQAFLKKGLSTGKEVGPMDVEVTCKDGTQRRVEFVGTFLGSRLMIAANDITERDRLEQQILTIAEQERERIGQDLHDGLCQLLSGIKFKTTLLEQKLQGKAPSEAAHARAIEGLLNTAIQQARNIARGLHPVDLEARGLMSALQGLASSVENVYGLSCICHFRKTVLVHDHITAAHLYRIAQEAISNAIKHGHATRIVIRLTGDGDRLTLAIQDNGSGFPARPKRKGGMGLHLMNYRARAMGARLDIQRGPSVGTIVQCRMRGTRVPNGASKTSL